MSTGTTLRFVLETRSGVRECTAAVMSTDVTLADLLAAAGIDSPAAVHVDGRRVPSDHLVDEAAVCQGSTIALDAPGRRVEQVRASDSPRLVVVAGAGTGRAVALDRPVVVGRAGDCDLTLPSDTVSRQHCRIVRDPAGGVRVTDLGATNGTWVGGHLVGRSGATAGLGDLVRVGAVVLRVEPPAPSDRPSRLDPLRHRTEAGTVPLNRPPRPAGPAPVGAVRLPGAGHASATAPPFNLAALVAPLALGAVMVVALGSWRYAAFMALSPVLLLANTISGRRRARREGRQHDRDRRQALTAFRAEVAAAAAAERDRRWSLLPSVPETLRRATEPSSRLWERRADHDDALQLHAGVGPIPWQVPTDDEQRPDEDAIGVLAEWTRLPRCPVPIDLRDGGVVGIVGDRERAADLARSLLLQACVHHGPADLEVAVVADEGHTGDWHWTTWLPHVQHGGGRRRLGVGRAAGALLEDLRDRTAQDRTLLLVCDSTTLVQGRDAAARAVLRGAGGPVAGVVLAPTVDQLPAVCDTIVEVLGGDGEARVTRPGERLVVEDVLVAGLAPGECQTAARRLAGFEDPEHDAGGQGLPSRVDLLDLLPEGLDVGRAWDRTVGASGLRTPIGVGGDGPVVLDLATDGPHGLLGGTTGSGKSELLRSLVAGLAAGHDPDHCTFVLIDYKGGAAFDALRDLPHVVGLVTDLDDHLGARALRCLEAELAHRERRLRAAGVSDLTDWRRLDVERRGEPLPRLVVVVDEFATLKAELPDFVDALVGIAQRGRSLGVHLLLGTQRPAGAVDENVRANANLRVALRMTDDRDALDVVGTVDAARIPPEQPGRGFLRRGPSAPVALQTALVTGRAADAAAAVSVHPVRFAPDDLPSGSTGPAHQDEGPTDLERLVAACRTAVEERGLATPRSPWPDPLPPRVLLHELPPGDAVVPIGLLDDPDGQRQVTTGWGPSSGNLLVHGAVGSGTTSTLATLAVSMGRTHSADELHLHVLDLGRGGLAALEDLPHCGAVVTAREPDRRARLEARLLSEADRRRRLTHDELAATPLHVLLVDGFASWLEQLDDPATYETFEAVQRLVADAPGLRMAVVGSVPRPGAVRGAVAAAVEHHLLHRLADPGEVAALGLRPAAVPDLPPGRAVRPDGSLLQVGHVADLPAAVAEVALRTPVPARAPAPVGVLPARVAPTGLGARLRREDGVWHVPVGIDAMSLEPVGWDLHIGDHAVVFGPPAAGRSGLLAGVAAAAAGDVTVVAVTDHEAGWPVRATVREPSALPEVLEAALAAAGPVLVLLDDAERLSDPGPALDRLASAPHVRVVAAARQDVVEADYGHWLRRLARARTGLVLRPVGEPLGDLLGCRLPRRTPVASGPSRGWLVAGGTARFVQTLAGAA